MVHHKHNSILAWLGLIFANTFHSNPPVQLDPLQIKRPISNHGTVRFNESTETEPASSQLKPSIRESPLWNAFCTSKPRILQLGCASMYVVVGRENQSNGSCYKGPSSSSTPIQPHEYNYSSSRQYLFDLNFWNKKYQEKLWRSGQSANHRH